MNIFILIIVGIAGIALGMYLARGARKSGGGSGENFAQKGEEEMDEIREEAREALTERTERRKDKILYLLENVAVSKEELKACGVEDIKKGITSSNVGRLLDVSIGTARKYLNELESENKIKQIGERGPDVYYILST